MNLLSVLSTIIYTAFFIGAGHMLSVERKSVLNRSACAVLLSLGWWSFCNSFFYVAPTLEQAWFWHRLSAIGWCGFVVLTAYYFLALTSAGTKRRPRWKIICFFAPAVILICKNLLGATTSLAQVIIPSARGWGWTYQNTFTSPWLWIYLLYVAAYFTFAFFLLVRWATAARHKMKREIAILFILLDVLTILFGVVTDVVWPLIMPGLPALASIATAFFGLGYFLVLYKYDLFNINLLISSEDILQTSNNCIFVIEETKEILRSNRAAGALLGYSKNELLGMDFMSLTAATLDLNPLYEGLDLTNLEARLRCKDGAVKDVLLSASIAKDKRNRFLCVIVSCQDVTKLKSAQAELEVERENYKKLADDYQQLANYDPLTGLPNRRHFFETLGEFERRYHAEQGDFAVIFLDLDNFKHVNDLFGHKGGDELLKVSAAKLRACAEAGEFVARLGGDEFMVLLPYTQTTSMPDKLRRIREEFQRPIPFSGQPYEIGISAGCAIFSEIGDTARLMQRADEAMYGNKKRLL